MTRRRCCCPCPDAKTDDFGRPNGTNINADWDETNGDTQILDDTAEMEAVADSLITWQTPPGGNKISFFINATTGPEEAGDIFRIAVNEVDEQNYYFAQWSLAEAKLSLWKRQGGSNTKLIQVDAPGTPDIEGNASLTVCFTPKIFSAAFGGFRSDQRVWVTNAGHFVNGYLAGLGGSGTTNRWDTFLWSEHWITNHDCPRCVCYCAETPLPMTLLATLTVGPGNQNVIDCGDGYSTELDFAQGLSDEWQGQVIIDPAGDDETCGACSEIGFGDFPLNLSFLCSSGDDPVGGFILHIEDASGQQLFALKGVSEDTSVGDTCDPFVIIFQGKQICGEGQPGQTDYTWTITIP